MDFKPPITFENWFKSLIPAEGKNKTWVIKVDGKAGSVAINVSSADGKKASAQERVHAALFVAMQFTGSSFPFLEAKARAAVKALMELSGAIDGIDAASSKDRN